MECPSHYLSDNVHPLHLQIPLQPHLLNYAQEWFCTENSLASDDLVMLDLNKFKHANFFDLDDEIEFQ